MKFPLEATICRGQKSCWAAVSTKDLVQQIKVKLPHYQDMAQTKAQQLGYRLPPLGRRRRPGVDGKMCGGWVTFLASGGMGLVWFTYMNGWFSMIHVGVYIYTWYTIHGSVMGILIKKSPVLHVDSTTSEISTGRRPTLGSEAPVVVNGYVAESKSKHRDFWWNFSFHNLEQLQNVAIYTGIRCNTLLNWFMIYDSIHWIM